MKTFPVLLLAAASTLCADYPAPYNSEPAPNTAPPSPQQSLAMMKLPPGFRASVFAAEPDVQNPIAMTWDARGRLWVAENYTYAERANKFDLRLRDRIVIFEDRNGDGHFSSRKVFTDDVQMVTSIEVGRGGVWLMCPPQVLFIPDRDGNDTPDGPSEVVLDGFTIPAENYHNFANGLRWGPDGWLYGRCGASAPGEIGLPGTPAQKRLPLRGTMWRYHPQRKTVEALACGTTNPWGHDWDALGELFFINTVNGHLWHTIPGAHYMRPHTVDPNPRAYALIEQHADHWHFDTAQDWSKSRDGAANAYGGGHAHCGVMIYLGDNWPAEYRGKLFTLNLHGRRANQECLERNGSGYVGKHGRDFFITDDTWFRGLDLGYGPDGGVFVLDWCDTGECHESTGVHRTSGRIYKITHGVPGRVNVGDLAALSSRDLVALQLHPNEWFARQARLQLAARGPSGETARMLREMFDKQPGPAIKLRALLSLYVIGAAEEGFLLAQLHHTDEHIRAWAVRLLADHWPIDSVVGVPQDAAAQPGNDILGEFAKLAATDPSGLVRLTLASTLQRLPVARRVSLAVPLVSHPEDAADHNLPLMVWYGLIPVADADPAALVSLAAHCQLPITRKHIARRIAEDIEKKPAPLNALLEVAAARKSEPFACDVLAGMSEALRGWRKARKPAAWDALAALPLRGPAGQFIRELSVVFGDGRALDEVKHVAFDNDAEIAQRRAALETLIANRPPDLREICEKLVTVRFLNTTAARGLTLFDDPAVGAKLAKSYRSFIGTERPAVIDALATRPSFAKALLDEIAAGRIRRSDVTPFHARQILNLNDAALTGQLGAVWGEVRESPGEKKQFIARLKTLLTPGALAQADKGRGRVLFETACAPCHTLYGHGGQVGPDLTGSGRDNLDYVLDNVVDPSAVVGADYRMSIVDLKDGRTLSALIAAKTERTLTLKTMNEVITVERGDIESIRESTLSIMPEGTLEALTDAQRRDLIAYLMTKTQVPLPDPAQSAETPKTAPRP